MITSSRTKLKKIGLYTSQKVKNQLLEQLCIILTGALCATIKTESVVVAIQTVREYFEGYTKQGVKKEKLTRDLQVMVRHTTDL